MFNRQLCLQIIAIVSTFLTGVAQGKTFALALECSSPQNRQIEISGRLVVEASNGNGYKLLGQSFIFIKTGPAYASEPNRLVSGTLSVVNNTKNISLNFADGISINAYVADINGPEVSPLGNIIFPTGQVSLLCVPKNLNERKLNFSRILEFPFPD